MVGRTDNRKMLLCYMGTLQCCQHGRVHFRHPKEKSRSGSSPGNNAEVKKIGDFFILSENWVMIEIVCFVSSSILEPFIPFQSVVLIFLHLHYGFAIVECFQGCLHVPYSIQTSHLVQLKTVCALQ